MGRCGGDCCEYVSRGVLLAGLGTYLLHLCLSLGPSVSLAPLFSHTPTSLSLQQHKVPLHYALESECDTDVVCDLVELIMKARPECASFLGMVYIYLFLSPLSFPPLSPRFLHTLSPSLGHSSMAFLQHTELVSRKKHYQYSERSWNITRRAQGCVRM